MSTLKALTLLALRRRPRSKQALGALALEALLLVYPPLRGHRALGFMAARAVVWAYPQIRDEATLRRLAARALLETRRRVRAARATGTALNTRLVTAARRTESGAS